MIDEKKFRLECDCHDMRCFLGFYFQPWIINLRSPNEKSIPSLDVDIQWHPGNIWKRLKKAWRVIRRNQWHESADIAINDFRKIEALRDFLNQCLEDEGEGGYCK